MAELRVVSKKAIRPSTMNYPNCTICQCLVWHIFFLEYSREEWFSVKYTLGLDFPNVSNLSRSIIYSELSTIQEVL